MSKKKNPDGESPQKSTKKSRDRGQQLVAHNEGIVCLPGATQEVTNSVVGRGASVTFVNGLPLDLDLEREFDF